MKTEFYALDDPRHPAHPEFDRDVRVTSTRKAKYVVELKATGRVSDLLDHGSYLQRWFVTFNIDPVRCITHFDANMDSQVHAEGTLTIMFEVQARAEDINPSIDGFDFGIRDRGTVVVTTANGALLYAHPASRLTDA